VIVTFLVHLVMDQKIQNVQPVQKDVVKLLEVNVNALEDISNRRINNVEFVIQVVKLVMVNPQIIVYLVILIQETK